MGANNSQRRRDERRASAEQRAEAHVCGPTCKKNRKAVK